MLPPTAQTAMWILYCKTPAHAAPYCTDSNVDIVLENPSTCCPLLHRQQCGYCIVKPQHNKVTLSASPEGQVITIYNGNSKIMQKLYIVR